MRYKAVIFDLDGVICHTDRYHYQAWKTIADRLHIPFDEKINDRLRGVSRMESLNIILEQFGGQMTDAEKRQLAEDKNDIYRRLLSGMTASDLSSEVKSTLDAIRASGVKLAIGSSSKNAGFILERIGLKDYFNAVSDGSNISRSKPDPQVFLMAADMLVLRPADCLVVEDAAAGLEAAHAGGMHCAAIGDAVNSGLAEYNLTAFSELTAICNGFAALPLRGNF